MASLILQIPLTAPQETAANAGIDAVKANIVNPVNLTKSERQSTPTIAEERAGMVADGIEIAQDAPNLVSGFFGTTPQFLDAVKYSKQLKTLRLKHEAMLEIIEDTEQLCLNFEFNFLRELYRSAKAAAEANVPGADAFSDKLAKYFEQNPPPPPVIVTP